MRASKSRKVELLRNVPLFGLCTQKELSDIAALGDEVTFAAGETLVKEGTPGRECFVVISGEARATLRGRKLGDLGPGEVIGEMALLDVAPRMATVTATTDMAVLALEPRSFSELLDRHPSVSKRLLAAMARRLREQSKAPAYQH